MALLWAGPGAAQEAGPTPPRMPRVDAAQLYTDACAPCHGSRGDGRGPAARGLGRPAPRDFTLGVFKFRSTPSGSLPTDEDLYRTVSRGVPGTWMVAWESRLTPAERWALVHYIKGFSGLFDEQAPDPALAVPDPPSASPDLIREGHHVYVMLGCSQCHGPGGRGDGPSAAELRDDWGASIRAHDLTVGIYRNGGSPADLYRTIVTGISGTPMPALEPTTVAFPGGSGAAVARLPGDLPADELREVEQWLSRQPSAREFETMSGEQRQELIEGRLWGLVYYLRSLDRPRGLLHRLLWADPEVAGEAKLP